jgi:hypothetical protein
MGSQMLSKVQGSKMEYYCWMVSLLRTERGSDFTTHSIKICMDLSLIIWLWRRAYFRAKDLAPQPLIKPQRRIILYNVYVECFNFTPVCQMLLPAFPSESQAVFRRNFPGVSKINFRFLFRNNSLSIFKERRTVNTSTVRISLWKRKMRG